MSLKTFHIFFISLSVILAFGFAWWAFQSYSHEGSVMMLIGSIISIFSGISLIVYEINFLKKLKNVSFR